MYYNSAAGSFLSKKVCSRLHSTEVDFYSKKGKVRFLSHLLGDIEVTYTLHLQLIGKPVYDFLFAITELFSLAKTLQVEICRRERLLKGVGYFDSQNCKVEFLSHPFGGLGERRCFMYTSLEEVWWTSYR